VLPVNKTALVNEVKERLGVSTARARSVVDTVLDEMQAAMAQGQKVTLRGLGVLEQVKDGTSTVLGFTPAKALAETWKDATDDPGPRQTKPAASKPAASKAAASKAAASKAPASKAAAPKAAATRTATKKSAPAARKTASAAPPVEPTEPNVVPYEPMHDPVADALAAVAAEQSRPELPPQAIGISPRVVSTMPEPELQAEPDTLAYSSGEADTDESIGDLTGRSEG
jgi:hypothetical protein